MGNINWVNKCWVTTVYLVRDDKKVLLTFNKNLQTWIPVGGHIDPGETPEEAIKREVAEETGFEFEFYPGNKHEDEGRLRVLNPQRVQIEQVPHHNHHINLVFLGKCTKYHNQEETDEQEKLRWFSKEELLQDKTMLPNVREMAITAIDKVN